MFLSRCSISRVLSRKVGSDGYGRSVSTRRLGTYLASIDREFSNKTVRRLIARGALPAHRVGDCERIGNEALRTYPQALPWIMST